MFTAKDLKGCYCIICTPAKEGSGTWKSDNSVDLDATAKMINDLINVGINGVVGVGTLGECATLLDEEILAFTDTVVQTARKRIPVFIGSTRLGTRASIKMLRQVMSRGADGTLMGVPMWQAPTLETAVQHYGDVAEAVPNAPMIVYPNVEAFKYEFPTEFWTAVSAKTNQVIGAKGGARVENREERIKATKGKINFMPSEGEAFSIFKSSPDSISALLTIGTLSGPEPFVALWKAIEAKDMKKAEAVDADLKWAGQTFMPPGGPKVFNQYNIQLAKLRYDSSTFVKAGPNRPPYNVPMPENIAKGAIEAGHRFAELRKKYSAVKV